MLGAEHCVVYGVVTEICVRYAARGLQQAGKSVTVVSDAVAALKEQDGAAAIGEICAKGGAVATAAEIMAALS